MTPKPEPARRGARRLQDIPPDIRESLDRGEIEAITLAETLAVDFGRLARARFPRLPRAALEQIDAVQGLGITQRNATVGQALLESLGPGAYFRLARDPADAVRSWAAYLLAAAPEFTLGERLRLIRPLADDHHSGVREWAWLALRPAIAAEIEHAIDLLEPWTISGSPFLRRYASEATRPRGVWCPRIDTLVRQPALGLPILEPMRADPHKYVQDSVANWLNDAGKSQPTWVRSLCARWRHESSHPATDRICRRALRNL